MVVESFVATFPKNGNTKITQFKYTVPTLEAIRTEFLFSAPFNSVIANLMEGKNTPDIFAKWQKHGGFLIVQANYHPFRGWCLTGYSNLPKDYKSHDPEPVGIFMEETYDSLYK